MGSEFKFKRVLLKISGEALKGEKTHGYDAEAIRSVTGRVADVVKHGIQVVLVVGAGNIWRGVMGSEDFDRVNADKMGMLATVMNALCLRDFFRADGIDALVQCSVGMEPIAPRFDRELTFAALNTGRPVIFAGGTGSPFFTTDTTAALRALECGCEVILKATKVDGIYTADPFKDPSAKRFEHLSFDEAISRRLNVMDSTAFSMCRDNSMPIIVFNFSDKQALNKVLHGDFSAGTLVSESN